MLFLEMELKLIKVRLIVNSTPPIYVKEEMPFFRHVGFYCCFIKDFNKIARLLTNLLTKDVPFHISKDSYEEFSKLKYALILAPIFHPPISREPFELMCDTFDCAIKVF